MSWIEGLNLCKFLYLSECGYLNLFFIAIPYHFLHSYCIHANYKFFGQVFYGTNLPVRYEVISVIADNDDVREIFSCCYKLSATYLPVVASARGH